MPQSDRFTFLSQVVSLCVTFGSHNVIAILFTLPLVATRMKTRSLKAQMLKGTSADSDSSESTLVSGNWLDSAVSVNDQYSSLSTSWVFTGASSSDSFVTSETAGWDRTTGGKLSNSTSSYLNGNLPGLVL